MRYSFTTGDSGFTLDGLERHGRLASPAARSDITIRNSTFTTHATFDALANANILFDHNTHNNINSPSGAANARLGFYWGSSTPSGVTIRNSPDGRRLTATASHTGVAVNVIGNEFRDICDQGGQPHRQHPVRRLQRRSHRRQLGPRHQLQHPRHHAATTPAPVAS